MRIPSRQGGGRDIPVPPPPGPSPHRLPSPVLRLAPFALALAAGCAPQHVLHTEAAPVAPAGTDLTAPLREDVGLNADRVHALTETDLAVLLRSGSNRPRVVNFWATWCGPCAAELPMLDRLAASRPDVDVVLVSVDDPGDAPAVARVLAPTRLRSFLLQADAATILHREVRNWPDAIPVTLVVSADGAEIGRVVGAADSARINALLGEIRPAG